MPRKQRFKPSRKPKPQMTPEIPEVQRTSDPVNPEPDRVRPYIPDDIETGQSSRSSTDTSSVIEDAGSESHRA